MQFVALRDRLEAQDRPRGKVLELLLAQLTAMVANTGFRGFKEPLKAQDFLVTERPRQPQRAKRPTKAQREAVADSWREAMQALMAKQNG